MNAAATERRVLDEASGGRAMMGVMAVMLFLTALAVASGLGAAHARTLMQRELAGRLTVQVTEGDAARREAVAARVLAGLRALPEVARATPVDRAKLTALLRPWLGSDGNDPDLPVPAMIDVDLASDSDTAAGRVAAVVARSSGAARVDRHADWMSPVGGFMTSVALLAGLLVLLTASAAAAVVVLAVRAGLETHRATIEVMHMLGSTDVQIARLFQRRIARDVAIGGAVGTVAALGVAVVLGGQLAGLGSELLGGVSLATGDWVLLTCLPLLFVGFAVLVARLAVLTTLRRTL